MNEFEAKVLSELQVLKCQMDQLIGIGQPGRLEHLEARVNSSEQSVQKMQGVVAAFGTILTLAQVAIAYFGGHRN
jgi:hypothetical protein